MPFECEKCGATFYSETEFHEHEMYEMVKASGANTALVFEQLIGVLADISNAFQIYSVLKICSEQHCSFIEASEKYFDYWKTLHNVTQRKIKERQGKA